MNKAINRWRRDMRQLNDISDILPSRDFYRRRIRVTSKALQECPELEDLPLEKGLPLNTLMTDLTLLSAMRET